VPGGLFMTDIDNTDVLIQTRIIERRDVAAVQAEDDIDTLQLEGPDRQVSSG
jgi:hypothetical protein